MIVTPHASDHAEFINRAYTIEHLDGSVEQEADVPPEAFKKGAERELSYYKHDSWAFSYIRRKLKRKLNCIDDFNFDIIMPVIRSSKLDFSQLNSLIWSIIHNIIPYLKDFTPKQTEDDKADPTIVLINGFCSYHLSHYWSIMNQCMDKMYDLEGIRITLESMGTYRAQSDFLASIIKEMATPRACRLVDFSSDSGSGTAEPDWRIVMIYRHSILPSDMPLVEATQADLAIRAKAEFMDSIGVHTGARPNLPNRSEKEAASLSPKMLWKGSQTDLVFIIDCLKDAGLLDATDWTVTQVFDYGSNAQDKAKTYRDTRLKLTKGMSYPDKDKIESLLQLIRGRFH